MKGSEEFLHCLVRRTLVKALPEERVRQRLIQRLVRDLGFPQASLSVEVPLSSLPHLASFVGQIPRRRADLLVFSNELHPQYPFFPLLLVECKAVPLTEKGFRQIRGYNFFVRAPHLALVNERELWWQGPGASFVPGIPPYSQLVRQAKESI